MLYNQILVRFGDLTLKGKNQKDFLRRLYELMALKMKGLNVEIENMDVNDVLANEVFVKEELKVLSCRADYVCAKNINVQDIIAYEIEAENIIYDYVCYTYKSLKCKTIVKTSKEKS